MNNVLSASYARRPRIKGTLPINIPEFNRDKEFRFAPDPDAHPPRIPRRENEFQEIIENTIEEDREKSLAIIQKVNEHIASGNAGRLFAVIYVRGKQFRVATNDVLVLERWWPPTVGDQIIFEKVLLVGGSSFSLIGKPVLPNNLVKVHATVINKDLTHTKIRFRHIPKERVHKMNFVREETTYLRINDIELHPKLNISEPAVYTRI
jgi:large subunit ribosomal protein L21